MIELEWGKEEEIDTAKVLSVVRTMLIEAENGEEIPALAFITTDKQIIVKYDTTEERNTRFNHYKKETRR